jgi:hypothetical protein
MFSGILLVIVILLLLAAFRHGPTAAPGDRAGYLGSCSWC